MSCSSASDALLYERLKDAEEASWQLVKAAEKNLVEAYAEWEACTTAKRLFEEDENERRTTTVC